MHQVELMGGLEALPEREGGPLADPPRGQWWVSSPRPQAQAKPVLQSSDFGRNRKAVLKALPFREGFSFAIGAASRKGKRRPT